MLEHEPLIHIKVKIDNIYEDGENVVVEAEADVPKPWAEEGSDAHSEWEEFFIFPLTGTGQEEGDAGYFVEVLESSDPDAIPVGTEWEWC